jgi:hypothetical protein
MNFITQSPVVVRNVIQSVERTFVGATLAMERVTKGSKAESVTRDARANES